MKLLVFGANSQLGQDLTLILKREALKYVAVRDDEASLYQGSTLSELIRQAAPSQILNLSLNPGLFQSEADIDKQRSERLLQASVLLVKAAKSLKVPLIHHSSVAVFDGSNPKPYPETENPSPKNPLGKLALSLEKKVAKYERHVILRTEGIFGLGNPEFFRHCIESCKQDQGKLVLLDQRCSPTPVADAARVVFAINRQLDCNASPWGIFHYCALQATHRHTFVEDFLKLAAEYDRKLAAIMPRLEISTQASGKTQLENSVVDCNKIMATFGIRQRSRGDALRDLIKSIYKKAGKK